MGYYGPNWKWRRGRVEPSYPPNYNSYGNVDQTEPVLVIWVSTILLLAWLLWQVVPWAVQHWLH